MSIRFPLLSSQVRQKQELRIVLRKIVLKPNLIRGKKAIAEAGGGQDVAAIVAREERESEVQAALASLQQP
ncbi:MAG: hypothetical protein SW833_14520 [Cyanobacteriota bacterium]|nr:hypothetical protein [Cyanobacteriota bacterium]